MTEQQLIDAMYASYVQLESLKPVRPPCPRRERESRGIEKPIFTLNNLQQLLTMIQNSLEPSRDFILAGGVRYLMIRYVVQLDQTMLLARAGRPSISVPGHREMPQTPERCLTAGYLFLDEAMTQIQGIDHHSNDFEPSPGTIIFTLRVLFGEPGLNIAPNLNIWLNHYTRFEERIPFSENIEASIYLFDLIMDEEEGMAENPGQYTP